MRRRTIVALGAASALSACSGRRGAHDFESTYELDVLWGKGGARACHPAVTHDRRPVTNTCTFVSREVTAFGPRIPRDPPPAAAVCPIRVSSMGTHVIAEPLVFDQGFEWLPFIRCPADFLPVARHVVRFDDGFLVSEVGIDRGQLVWMNANGDAERRIARGRFVGFARTPSGAILTLAASRAHLGRGAVVKLERDRGSAWRATIIAVLPVEPTTTASDDHGAILGYAERFVFRVDETGRVENLFYVSRDFGHVASVVRTSDDTVYLGVECGIVKVTREGEQWWSARDGASGQWTSCAD